MHEGAPVEAEKKNPRRRLGVKEAALAAAVAFTPVASEGKSFQHAGGTHESATQEGDLRFKEQFQSLNSTLRVLDAGPIVDDILSEMDSIRRGSTGKIHYEETLRSLYERHIVRDIFEDLAIDRERLMERIATEAGSSRNEAIHELRNLGEKVLSIAKAAEDAGIEIETAHIPYLSPEALDAVKEYDNGLRNAVDEVLSFFRQSGLPGGAFEQDLLSDGRMDPEADFERARELLDVYADRLGARLEYILSIRERTDSDAYRSVISEDLYGITETTAALRPLRERFYAAHGDEASPLDSAAFQALAALNPESNPDAAESARLVLSEALAPHLDAAKDGLKEVVLATRFGDPLEVDRRAASFRFMGDAIGEAEWYLGSVKRLENELEKQLAWEIERAEAQAALEATARSEEALANGRLRIWTLFRAAKRLSDDVTEPLAGILGYPDMEVGFSEELLARFHALKEGLHEEEPI